jgi:hypothetical protein
VYEGALKSSRPKNERNESIISKLFLFFNIITATLHEDLIKFVISHSICLRMINISDKMYWENQNTHFISDNFFPENRAVCEIMWKLWKYVVAPDSQRMTM